MADVKLHHMVAASHLMQPDHIPEMLNCIAVWLADGVDPAEAEADPYTLMQGLADGAMLDAVGPYDDPNARPYVDYAAEPLVVVHLSEAVEGETALPLVEPTGAMLSRAGRRNQVERIRHVVCQLAIVDEDTADELLWADAACIYAVYASFLLFPSGSRPWNLAREMALTSPTSASSETSTGPSSPP